MFIFPIPWVNFILLASLSFSFSSASTAAAAAAAAAGYTDFFYGCEILAIGLN